MKEILYNLANWHLVMFCKEHNIDCSGTHCVKSLPRKQQYALCRDKDGLGLVYLTFHKSSSPTYQINPQIK